MKLSRGVSRAEARSISDRNVLWLGVASLLVASLSYAFAWHGGLWAIPVWSALVIATWRRAWRWETTGWTRAGVAMAGVAVLTGCYAFTSSGGIQPSLRTDSASYARGEVVGLQLKAGIRSVGYNLCFSTLERRAGDSWERIPVDLRDDDGTISACTSVMRILPPLLVATGDFHLPRDLPSGSYRLVNEPEVGGERRQATTSPFTVGGHVPAAAATFTLLRRSVASAERSDRVSGPRIRTHKPLPAWGLSVLPHSWHQRYFLDHEPLWSERG